jgi:hypothetical protein
MIKVGDIHGRINGEKIFFFQNNSITLRFKRNKNNFLRFFIYYGPIK